MDKKALWQRVFTTDPRAVKPITGKQYNGHSPKPYWIIERLTDEFGPCGLGWGFNIVSERFERFSETSTLHIAQVRFWYVLDGQRGELEQIGQTVASYVTKTNVFKVDEDAPKKSVTDALVKCASYLGFAGDIFSGRWDDSKYVDEANREWRERDGEGKAVDKPAGTTPIKPVRISATDGAADLITAEERKAMDEVADYLKTSFDEGRELDVLRIWYESDTFSSNEQRVYVWHQLKSESKLRSFINDNRRQPAAA